MKFLLRKFDAAWHCVQQKEKDKGKLSLSVIAAVVLFYLAQWLFCFVLFLQCRKIMHAVTRSLWFFFITRSYGKYLAPRTNKKNSIPSLLNFLALCLFQRLLLHRFSSPPVPRMPFWTEWCVITHKANWAKYPVFVFSPIVLLEQHWQRPLKKASTVKNGINRLRSENLRQSLLIKYRTDINFESRKFYMLF